MMMEITKVTLPSLCGALGSISTWETDFKVYKLHKLVTVTYCHYHDYEGTYLRILYFYMTGSPAGLFTSALLCLDEQCIRYRHNLTLG